MKRETWLYIFLFVLSLVIPELISTVLDQLMPNQVALSPWQRILIALGLMVILAIVMRLIDKTNEKKSLKGNSPKFNPNLIDREGYIKDIMATVKVHKITILSGEEGIGKTEIVKRIIFNVNQNKDLFTAAFYHEIEESTSFEDFIREFYYRLYKKTPKIQRMRMELEDTFTDHLLFVVLDFQSKLGEEQNKIIEFINGLQSPKTRFLLSTNEIIKLDANPIINVSPLSVPDRIKVVNNYIKASSEYRKNPSTFPHLEEDTQYLCSREPNTSALLLASEGIIHKLTPDKALSSTKEAIFTRKLERYLDKATRQNLLSAICLLDFPPTFEQLLSITGEEEPNLRRTIDYLIRTRSLTVDTNFTDSTVYRIDHELKNFLLTSGRIWDIASKGLQDSWVSWALQTSQLYASRENWDEHIYAFLFLSTYQRVLAFCKEEKRYGDLIQLWENLDYFLSLQQTPDIYEAIGNDALYATQEIKDEYTRAVIQSEVLGYILVYKRPLTQENFNKAMDYFSQAGKYFEGNGHEKNLATSERYKARLMIKKAALLQGNEKKKLLSEAKEMLENSFNFLDPERDTVNICLIYNCLSDIERYSGNPEKAIDFQDLRKRLGRSNNLKDVEAKAYYQLGRLYQDLDNNLKAKRNFHLALSIANVNYLAQEAASAHFRLAEIALEEGDLPVAKKEINHALDIAKKINLENSNFDALLQNISDTESSYTMREEAQRTLPNSVNAHNLPLRNLAPCWVGGQINEPDEDQKRSICVCKYRQCKINARKIIISTEIIISTRE